MSRILDTLRQLSDIPGPSGREEAVRDAIIAQIDGHCEYETDALGNLIVFKKGKRTPKNRLLFSAHMDEVGFLITHIEESGLLRFTTVGGIDSRVILGKAVEVGPKRIYGVIGSKAVHHQKEDEREKPVPVEQLLIDIGAKSREEAAEHLSPGEFAVYRAEYRTVGPHKIMGRAFDDRAGCAILIDLIRGESEFDCHFSFTVQEEVGCVGAAAAAYRVKPDIAVAIETTTASDIAGVPGDKAVCYQGQGPVVSFMDRGTVYDHALYALALGTAKRREIPCQAKQGVYGGNESRSLQAAGAGARVMAISLPCRYLHSPSVLLDTRDIAPTRDLLHALIGELAEL